MYCTGSENESSSETFKVHAECVSQEINDENESIGINRGENNGMAITDRNEIIAMRNDYDSGMSISKIMIKYNKKNSFTYQIVKRLRWSWLNDSSFGD